VRHLTDIFLRHSDYGYLDDTTTVTTFLDSIMEQYEHRAFGLDCPLQVYLTRPHASSSFQSQYLEDALDVADRRAVPGVSVQMLYDDFYHDFGERGRGNGKGDDADQMIQYMYSKVRINVDHKSCFVILCIGHVQLGSNHGSVNNLQCGMKMRIFAL
jgi:hypothetical protein